MLGGQNIHNLSGTDSYAYYVIEGWQNEIRAGEYIFGNENMYFLTLEEFLEKYPFKVGDKVELKVETIGKIGTITMMDWDSVKNTISYWVDGYCFEMQCNANELKPYKEEIMEKDTNKDIFEGQSCDIMNDIIDIIKEESMEEKGDKAKAPNLVGEDYSGKRFGYKIPQGYEIDCIQNNEIIIKPIKPKYPETYEECCELLSLGEDGRLYTKGYKSSLIQDFQKLLVCRDAYWKIAGKQMGLDKPWEPCVTKCKYGIRRAGDEIMKIYSITCVLEFPTAEMRDAFYNNFKELIEDCKKLL